MAEVTSELMLEIMRAVRADIGALREDVRDVKHRLSSLDLALVGVRRELAGSAEMDALRSVQMDRLSDRLGRIERRRDIVEA